MITAEDITTLRKKEETSLEFRTTSSSQGTDLCGFVLSSLASKYGPRFQSLWRGITGDLAAYIRSVIDTGFFFLFFFCFFFFLFFFVFFFVFFLLLLFFVFLLLFFVFHENYSLTCFFFFFLSFFLSLFSKTILFSVSFLIQILN